MSAQEPVSQSTDKKRPHDEELEELMRTEFARLGLENASSEAQGSRRKLLLVYIHGFLGSEESFRAFPAHVHSLLSILLEESHIVHSKIYPRYKSKQYIQVARDDFSKWLKPHESSTTDVVLLGHSMGGLISAEVVLIPGQDSSPLLHNILGTISFDVPYLGMHPGVVKSGLASIFYPAKDPQDKYQNRSIADHAMAQLTNDPAANDQVLDSNDSSFWEKQDGNFNAAFSNDVVLPVRKFWQSLAHFVHKHGRDVAHATHTMVSSHMEFMSAMSNSKELKQRYSKIRVLEEDDEKLRRSVVPSRAAPPRVRFANYYTVSTGRPKSEHHDKSEEEQITSEGSEHSDKQTTLLEAEKAGLLPPASSSDAPSSSNASTISLPPFGEVESVSQSTTKSQPSQSRSKSPKPPREGTFCTLPPKDANGERDPTWIRMFMEDVDEVGAHCGMFFVDERYERFVGDVAGRIEDWVKTDMSVRAAQAELAVD